eukprot:5484369-Ditylum_brightwellii.AAC.1
MPAYIVACALASLCQETKVINITINKFASKHLAIECIRCWNWQCVRNVLQRVCMHGHAILGGVDHICNGLSGATEKCSRFNVTRGYRKVKGNKAFIVA